MPSSPAAAGSFVADLVTGPLTVQRFVDLRDTPGNVGICLSGGGSRALTAGMGQLRGLQALGLLEKTRALSTVSGGSWVGVTFEYLPAGTADDAYLNAYVADPGRLVPTTTAGHAPAETLDVLPKGNVGNAVATDLFSVPALAVEAFLLHKFFKTPVDFLWQALIGLHILKPYGLFKHDRRFTPTALYSWDGATLERDVTRHGAQLTGESANLVAGGAGHVRRPFLLCNTSMFVVEPGAKFRLLAPVQATPFFTGIVGSPGGTDANGRMPGGGGVTSFAFGSNPVAVAVPEVTVAQSRQWAIADIVGASSAAFAETLGNLFTDWCNEPDKFLDVLDDLFDDVFGWLGRHLGPFAGMLAAASAMFFKRRLRKRKAQLHDEVKGDLAKLQELIPEYAYWPVAGVQPFPETRPTQFADGGSLENTGVADLLTYGDVERIVAFVNSSQRLETIAEGVIGADGAAVPGTGILIDSQVPPLYGYQPYKKGVGYRLYAGASDPEFPEGRNSQVFPAADFAGLLQGLWRASGSGTYQKPALLAQSLAVEENRWFGVAGGRTVTVLWVYTARVRDWYDALSPDVQAILGDFDDPQSYKSFPHYATFDTDLKPTAVNLLASLTAWTVAADENRGEFERLYGA